MALLRQGAWKSQACKDKITYEHNGIRRLENPDT